MRVDIYCRISKDRVGAGLGVGTQEVDCRELAASLGATVVAVRTDNDVSAYSGKPRPGYRALLEDIATGRVDAVLCWHTDRLHRSPAELEEYITLCETAGVRTVTVKAGDLDLASPSGLVMARTLGAFARYEVDHAVERMQRAKRRSAEAGTWKGGRRPFGYEADGVTIRETEAALIRRAADQILAGESVRSIVRDWNASGTTTTTGKPWNLTGPRRVLLRPRNAGLMEHRGEVIGEASWPAILDVEKWRAVVRLLTTPGRATNAGGNIYRHLGSGLYRCGECEATLVANQRAGVRVYRCRALHVTRTMTDLDDYVSLVIAERLRRPDAVDLLRPVTPDVDVLALEDHSAELRTRLDQLGELFAEGSIDARQVAAGSKVLNAELEDIAAQIDDAYAGSAFGELVTAPDAGAVWLGASLERRRAILDALATVTVCPSPSGRPAGWKPGESYFRPDTVRVDWKRGPIGV